MKRRTMINYFFSVSYSHEKRKKYFIHKTVLKINYFKNKYLIKKKQLTTAYLCQTSTKSSWLLCKLCQVESGCKIMAGSLELESKKPEQKLPSLTMITASY
jgi:hypothetical protein